MKIRQRLAAVIAMVGLASTGLALAAPAAQAAPTTSAAPKACKIEGFTPSTVVVGLSPKKVKFTPKVSGCKVTSWSIATDNFIVTNKDPYATLVPAQLPKVADPVIEVTANNGLPTKEAAFVDGLHYKAPAVFNTRTKAGPEPVKKGKKITVTSQLAVAVWKQNGYTGYAGQRVKVQFRTKHGTYKTVKTVETGEYGYTQTTVTAKKSGDWRMVFAGNSSATSAKARGDYVKVK
ncbi:MAG: hypothetical protein ABWX96_11495 [Propionibacteriaceae bacterium]